ncbi:peptidoglycan bridge formation glycyltransferase FemA/FemB family protein [Patescibacteria group bacterium]|nr:peptidoglycan bridge formation glycyltransferase FemA/FemB family protein [Patescibacteria group bacterium]
MEIIEVTKQSKQEWDDFILLHGDFLQSWFWGDFQKKLNRQVWRLAVKQNDKIILAGLIIKYNLPFRRSYFYIPRGPVFPLKIDELALKLFFNKIKQISSQSNAIFFRIEPSTDIALDQLNLHFKRIKDIQPSITTILDISIPKQEILANMHYKTRYNIKLADRHNVQVFQDNSDKYIEIFLNLLHKTASRQKFNIHSDDYYKKLINFNKSKISLYFAKYKNKILCGYLVLFWKDTAFYLHGGSSLVNKNVMAPHLLHWSIIQQAIKQGVKQYDFWGINKLKWINLTRFKKSFGGNTVKYLGTFDVINSSRWYWLYKLGKIIKL